MKYIREQSMIDRLANHLFDRYPITGDYKRHPEFTFRDNDDLYIERHFFVIAIELTTINGEALSQRRLDEFENFIKMEISWLFEKYLGHLFSVNTFVRISKEPHEQNVCYLSLLLPKRQDGLSRLKKMLIYFNYGLRNRNPRYQTSLFEDASDDNFYSLLKDRYPVERFYRKELMSNIKTMKVKSHHLAIPQILINSLYLSIQTGRGALLSRLLTSYSKLNLNVTEQVEIVTDSTPKVRGIF